MSIFDPAFHTSKKKLKPKQPASAFPAPPPTSPPPPKNDPPIDDVSQAFEKMKKLHNELNKEIDKAFQISGRDPREVDEYFNEASNFSSKEWISLQERKESLEQHISGLSSSELKEKKKKKQTLKMSKDRKSKTLGARKNWLFIR
ncbi:hypothetical protein PHSC3_001267 [Chlamydiales bacterium STE3]|nr:hypothetical protein PHSC3_001267 [Chlamydiales bacterium STE3]